MASHNVHNGITELKRCWYSCHDYFNRFYLLGCFLFCMSNHPWHVTDKAVKGQPTCHGIGMKGLDPVAFWSYLQLHGMNTGYVRTS